MRVLAPVELLEDPGARCRRQDPHVEASSVTFRCLLRSWVPDLRLVLSVAVGSILFRGCSPQISASGQQCRSFSQSAATNVLAVPVLVSKSRFQVACSHRLFWGLWVTPGGGQWVLQILLRSDPWQYSEAHVWCWDSSLPCERPRH